MDRLRLDPAAPLASLLAWLDALLKSLGIDPSTIGKVRLDYASLAELRGWLADWSGQLRALARREAALLAFQFGVRIGVKRNRGGRLSLPSPLWGGDKGVGGEDREAAHRPVSRSCFQPPHPCPSPTRGEGDRRTSGRVVAFTEAGRSVPHVAGAQRQKLGRPAPDAWISDQEDSAIRARVHAVLDAMADPCALIRRLALRLGRRLARAKAARAALRGRKRFPHPPRVIAVLQSRTLAPEPRPPNLLLSVPA